MLMKNKGKEWWKDFSLQFSNKYDDEKIHWKESLITENKNQSSTVVCKLLIENCHQSKSQFWNGT